MLPALVLTAGLGTRLDPLTRIVAKPAVPIAGRTLVERVLGWLAREGVRDVVLNLHHRPETIAAVVGDGTHLGLRVRYSWEQPILGSAGGPRHALPLLDDDRFLIVNGDTLCEIPLAPIVDAHAREQVDVAMTLVPNQAPNHYNGVMLDGDGRVSGFVPRGQADGSWHFVGIQVVRRQVFAGLPDGVPMETVSGLYREMVARADRPILGWRVTQGFLDVGTARDYLEAALALSVERDPIIEPGGIVDRDADVRQSVVWTGARVAGAVTVPRGYHAENSVIVPAAIAGDDADAIVDEGVARFSI